MESQSQNSIKIEKIYGHNDIPNTDSLSEMFDVGFEMYSELINEKLDKPTNSYEVQSTIKRLIDIFETVTKLVSIVNMFSSNENLDDLPTENLKFLLLPALLGSLTIKICGEKSRLHLLDVAQVYFNDFLQRLKSYQLFDIDLITKRDDKKELLSSRGGSKSIQEMVRARDAKIQRYKTLQELKKKLEILQNNSKSLNIDEEVKREYFITLNKMYANQVIDDLSSIEAERPILEHVDQIDYESKNRSNREIKEQSNLLKPIIITRDAHQKKVYGAGYPSLPVLTVEEFYEQKVESGEWFGQITPKTSKHLEDQICKNYENSKIDKKDDKNETFEDDSKSIVEARLMDEYKDTHRHGWGNRKNRS